MAARERRPRDPGRPERIIRAAREIIRAEGVVAVTHRRVAEHARVPLGSTTYYFSTIEDLLGQAIEEDIAAFQQRVRADLAASEGLPARERVLRLIRAEEELTDVRRADYQLYLASLSRPALMEHARAWSDVVVDLFAQILPRPTAIAVSALLDGYAMREMLAPGGQDPDWADIQAHVTALIQAGMADSAAGLAGTQNGAARPR